VVQLVAYTRHLSPPILAFRVALHNRFQYACLGKIQDALRPSAKRPSLN
jgi:hypothetical protein